MNAHPRSPLDSAALSGIPAWDTAWSFDPAPDAPTYRSLEPGLVAFWTDFLGEPPAALAPVAPDFARALALGIDDPTEGATWLRLPTGGVLAPGTIWKTGACIRHPHERVTAAAADFTLLAPPGSTPAAAPPGFYVRLNATPFTIDRIRVIEYTPPP